MATPEQEMTRVPLSRERVLSSGVAFADEHGLDGLSMRRLGQELGVEAMSLYNHVANKDDLIGGMVDLVIAEAVLADPEGAWRHELEQSCTSAYEAIERHPWSPSLMMTPDYVGPARLGFMDAILGTLTAAGFSDVMVHHAFHALDSHIVGTALRSFAYTVEPEDEEETARAFMATLPEGAYPYLIEHIQWHAISDYAEYTEFEFGLKLVFDALERSLED